MALVQWSVPHAWETQVSPNSYVFDLAVAVLDHSSEVGDLRRHGSSQDAGGRVTKRQAFSACEVLLVPLSLSDSVGDPLFTKQPAAATCCLQPRLATLLHDDFSFFLPNPGLMKVCLPLDCDLFYPTLPPRISVCR